MFTKHALKFLARQKRPAQSLVKAIEPKTSGNSNTIPGDEIIGGAMMLGLGAGAAAGVVAAGVELGQGKIVEAPLVFAICTSVGGLMGASLGAVGAGLVHAPKFTAGVACTLGTVAAVTAVKNKL